MINLLFCGNRGVFDGILTATLSALMRTKGDEPFSFYIFTMDVSHIREDYLPISAEQFALYEQVVKEYGAENRARLIDVTELYREELGGCPNEAAYCSPYTLIRLLADRVEGLPSKLLYLDADVLFNRDARLLYGIDVSNYEYAAARDHYGKFLISPGYINAGVILFNLERAKQTGLFAKARDELRAQKLPFADQSALIRATERRLLLPQKYNDQKLLKKNTVVRHFSRRLFWLPYPHVDNVKQWQVSRVHKLFGYYQFDDILYEYLYLKRKLEKGETKNDI